MTHVKAACLSGVVLSSPVWMTQVWLFIAPGLLENEKKAVGPLIWISLLLFWSGVTFAFYLVLPFSIQFFLSYQTETMLPWIGVAPYFSFLIGTLAAFGVLFDFPILLVGLVRLGVVEVRTLAKARKVIIVVLFILAAALTPSPDPVSQCLLAFPLWMMYEISLGVGRVFEKSRKAGG